ncbi:MAG TPA: hypothetical protein VFV27_01675 [Nevskiaceae bacterium]|nr:hypothetical protein [Nevskiaceae bacterium]
MTLSPLSPDSRLRRAALLLPILPAIVAAASFAHGHGSLELRGLLAILAACLALGGSAGWQLLRLSQTPRFRRPRAVASSSLL